MSRDVFTRYECDRCGLLLEVPGEIDEGGDHPPVGWEYLETDVIDGGEAHLCPTCKGEFSRFLNAVPQRFDA